VVCSALTHAHVARLGFEDRWTSPRDLNVLLQDYLPKSVITEEILQPPRPRGLRFYAQDTEASSMFRDGVRDVRLLARAYPEMYDLALRIMIPHRAEILPNSIQVPFPYLEMDEAKPNHHSGLWASE